MPCPRGGPRQMIEVHPSRAQAFASLARASYCMRLHAIRVAALASLTAAVVTTTFLPGVARATHAPGTCDGYPQPRVFLESQAWWQTAPSAFGSDFGHVHAGTCFPYLQSISGVVPFDVVTKLHDNPGLL